MTTVPDPPDPFDPLVATLPAGTQLFRVHRPPRSATAFNDRGGRGRWSPLGQPPVPVWYGAATAIAAVCESILHDVSPRATLVPRDRWVGRVESRIVTRRELHLAQFHGVGLRKLRVSPEQLTTTVAATYHQTVRWADAAHEVRPPLDGLVWMSRQCNSDPAVMLFGDRVSADDLAVDQGSARLFLPGSPDFDWLSAQCAVMGLRLLLR